MKNFITKSKFNDVIIKLAAIIFWLLIWHIVSITVSLQIVLPTPISVLEKLLELAATVKFWTAICFSFIKIIAGIGIGIVLALVISVLTAKVNTFNALFSVPLNVIKSTPVASFIIMALVWIKSGYIATFVTAVMVLPIVWSNMHEGIISVDKKSIEVGKCYNFTFKKNLRYIYVPHLRPFFNASLTSAAGLGWKAGIAAEVIASPKDAIGAYLNDAKVYLETEEMFAWTVAIIVLSALIQFLIKALSQKRVRRNRI